MPQTLRAPRPDLEARAFLRFVKLSARRPLESLSVPQLRLVWRLSALALGRRTAVASANEHVIDGPGGPITLRVFTPTRSDTPRPAFLWCHGGGFMVGGLDSADSICRSIASSAGCITIAVQYRLAPEHDLHAGRQDFLAALDWVTAHGQELGIDTARLAVGGDSAGGNIAAAVAQTGVRPGGSALCLQVLAYPATDLLQVFASREENAEGYLITVGLIDHIQRVIGTTPAAADPWLSPRRNPDMRGLPPALVLSAGYDPIRDDGLDYAARLRAAAVSVQLLHYPGQIHGFLSFDSVLGAGRDGLQRIGEALAAAFRGEVAPDRTVEIGDAGQVSRRVASAVSREVTATMFLAWVSAERWYGAMLRLLLPRTTGLYARLLRPWTAPAGFVRRSLFSRLARLAARQTYPAGQA